MDFKKSLGSAIRRWREQAGMSQEGLAKAAGDLDKQTIYRLEKGRVWPEYESLEKICNALGVTLEDEVGIPYPPAPPEKPSKLTLFERVATLDESQAKELLALLDDLARVGKTPAASDRLKANPVVKNPRKA